MWYLTMKIYNIIEKIIFEMKFMKLYATIYKLIVDVKLNNVNHIVQ